MVTTNIKLAEINGLNGCGGSIFNRNSFLDCLNNTPDYQTLGNLDDRLTWASDVIITFLFMYNNKISRKWLDHSEECRGKIFGSTAFDHQYKYFYDKKWSEYYLKNTELDKNNNFIFTACSDAIFEDQMIPFFASLKENTNFNGTVLVIDYGLSDKNLIYLINNNVRVIPGIGKYEIVSDRFVSINRYINFLNNPHNVFSHYDCDIWFNKDISHIFDMCRKSNTALCAKDVWHCGFLHDCVRNEEHKEFNRNILFEVENKCGKVLQAGFICGDMKFWNIFSQYIDKLITNGYLKNSFGTDELSLNLMYYYMEKDFTILPIGYNTLPQWGVKDINNVLIATDFHTDSKLSSIHNHTEEVFAIHLSSAARNKKEFEYIDYKIRHKEKYLIYLNTYKLIPNIISKDKIIINYGYRHTLPQLLKETNSKIICEIGVQTGGNLFHMVKSSNVDEAYGIDIWKNTDKKSQNDIGLSDVQMEDMYSQVVKVSKEIGNIQIIRDFSLIAAKQFNDEYFDFVYIDADHSYEGCRDDIYCWWNKVKRGGILAGDDYVNAISSENVKFGVIDAVNEFVNTHKLSNYFFNTWGKDNKGSSPQWFIIKQ